MAGSDPNLWRLEDRRIEANDIVAHSHHCAPPLLFHVAQKLSAKGPVVIRGTKAAIDLGGLEHEATLLGKVDDGVEIGWHHWFLVFEVLLSEPMLPGGLGERFIDRSTKPTAPALILRNASRKLVPVEIRPQNRGEHILAVRRLPKEEIGRTVLSAGTDNKVGIGHFGKIEMILHCLLIDLNFRSVDTLPL